MIQDESTAPRCQTPSVFNNTPIYVINTYDLTCDAPILEDQSVDYQDKHGNVTVHLRVRILIFFTHRFLIPKLTTFVEVSYITGDET